MIGNKRLVSSRGTAASNCVKKKTQSVPHSIGKSVETKTKENSKTLKKNNDFINKTNASSLRQSSPAKSQCQQTISSAAKITPRPNAAAKNQGNLPSGFSNNLNTKQSFNKKTASVNTLAKNPRSLPTLNSRSVSKPPTVSFANKLSTSTNKIKSTNVKLNSRPQMPSVHPVAFIKDESKKFRQKTRDQLKLSVPNTIQEEDSKMTLSLDQNNLSTASPKNNVPSNELCCPKICGDTNISDSPKEADNLNALSSIDVLLQGPKHLHSNERSPLTNSVRDNLFAEVLVDKSKVLGLNINNKVQSETELSLNLSLKNEVSLTCSEMESQNLCADCSNANENDRMDGVRNNLKENNQSFPSNTKYENYDLLLNQEYFRKEEFKSVNDTSIEYRDYNYTSERNNFRLNDDPYEGISCVPSLDSEDLKQKIYSNVPDKLHLCTGDDKLINKKSVVSNQIAADKVDNVTDDNVQRSYTEETIYENTAVLPEKLIDDLAKNTNKIVDSQTLINIQSNEFDILEINVEIGKKVNKVHDINDNDDCSNFDRENEIENVSEFDGKTFIWAPSKIARFRKSRRALAEDESRSAGRNNVYSYGFLPDNDKSRIYRDIPCDQPASFDHSDELPEPKCAEYQIDSSLTSNDNCETQFDELEDDVVWIPSSVTNCTVIESKLEGIRRISESHNVRISDKLFINNEIGNKITTDVMISKDDFIETADTSNDFGFELASLNISEPTIENSCETFENDEQCASEQDNYFQGVDTLALLDFSSNELEKDDENCFDQSILALFPEDVVFCQGDKELYHCQTLAKDNDDDCAFESEKVSETIDNWNSVWVDYKTPIKDNQTEPSGENVNDVWIIDENSCDDQPQNSDTIVLLDPDDNDWTATERNLDELRNCLDECKMEAESAAEEIKRIQIKSNRKISDVNKCFKSHCQKRRSKRYKPQKGVSRCNIIYLPSEDNDRLESKPAHKYENCANRGNDSCVSSSPSPYEDDVDYYSVSSSGEDFEPEYQSSSNSIEPQKSYLSFGKSCSNYKKKKDGRLFVSFFNIFKI